MSIAQVYIVVAATVGSQHGMAVRMVGYTHIRVHYLWLHQPEEEQHRVLERLHQT